MNIKNIAIIAHVDHGKTTLVDQLLKQTNSIETRNAEPNRIMDSNDLEKERGITILAKNTSITWRDHHINIVDTPGHADFGGEVERVLSMVDSVLLLVDAVEGPMPQTRFVTEKAFAQGLNPIVVVNKIDRDNARPDWVINQVFDLFANLGASDEQLDFPVVYASAITGIAGLEPDQLTDDLTPLLETILTATPSPQVDLAGAFQMQISLLDYSTYIGAIGIGRVKRGQIIPNSPVTLIDRDGKTRNARLLQILKPQGLKRVESDSAQAGDIIAITGIDNLKISDTICTPGAVEALPPLVVDEPTVSVMFHVNNSPFAGQDGKHITSRKIYDRLQQELIYNVALRVEDSGDPDKFRVSGRGELHLSILIETMRREGYELAIARPEVIVKETPDGPQEPYEQLTVDVNVEHQGDIMTCLGERKAQLSNMEMDGHGRVRMDYIIPTRGLIGLHTEFLNLSSGTGLIYHVFDHYGPLLKECLASRKNGVLISNCAGKTTGYALWNLQQRGRLMIDPQQQVYEGMIVGLHNRDSDLVVNVTREKKLTNVRASGTDENIVLTPSVKLTLEQGMEFIDDDELLEITPLALRIRKKNLRENERKRATSTKSSD